MGFNSAFKGLNPMNRLALFVKNCTCHGKKNSKFLLHTLQVLSMCTLCGSTNINTIIEIVPNCL